MVPPAPVGPGGPLNPDASEIAHILANLRVSVSRCLEPGSDMPSPRRAALLREALVQCGRLEVLLAGPRNPSEEIGALPTAPAAAPRQPERRAPRGASSTATVIKLRPRASATPIDMQHVRTIAEQHLRSAGDHSRLLEPANELDITLDCDRPGGLAVLRRIARGLAAREVSLDALDYAILEFQKDENVHALRPDEREWQTLTFEPERDRPLRVLAVDDNETVLAVIVEHLQACHPEVEIRSTTSAYDACVLFGEFEPDLVILDIRMPEIDGRDAISTMQRARAGRDVKFIAASATPEHFPEMLKRGCTHCLQKPFDLDDLAALVDASLADVPTLRRAA